MDTDYKTWSSYTRALLLGCCAFLLGATTGDEAKVKPVWRESFAKTVKVDGREMPDKWEFQGKSFTPAAVFQVEKDGKQQVLRMTGDKATGALMRDLSSLVDLEKAPIMRWCWRVNVLPEGADGRQSAKDDQAIGLYVGTGRISQESVAYRWETVTPVDAKGEASYGGGFVKVKWFALRNEKDKLKTWYVEQRDVAADFKRAYGYIPTSFALTVSCNSQYTGKKADAELAWVEFLPADPVKKKTK